MASFSKPAGSFDLETGIRLLLLINNCVALALNFAVMRALFIATGSVMAVSILFNLLVLLVKTRRNRLNSKNGDNQKRCPSVLAWAVELLGVVAFLSLYVACTIESANPPDWRWEPVFLKTYASVGTLVTFVMHGFMVLVNLHEYIKYRQTLCSQCPHCHRELGFLSPAPDAVALPPSPLDLNQAAAAPRESFSANLVGESEGDMLIMKS